MVASNLVNFKELFFESLILNVVVVVVVACLSSFVSRFFLSSAFASGHFSSALSFLCYCVYLFCDDFSSFPEKVDNKKCCTSFFALRIPRAHETTTDEISQRNFHDMSPHRRHASSRDNNNNDEPEISGPSPERVIKFVFSLVMMKAVNDAYERQHGISPINGFLDGLNELRKKLARAIMPNGGGSGGGASGNRKKKSFKGKGNKLGRK